MKIAIATKSDWSKVSGHAGQNRVELSMLMNTAFPAPSCGECSDFKKCFSAEE